MRDRKKLLDRIRKCFALAHSSNEHEAAAALARARTLMEEYEVSDADIALAGIAEESSAGSRTVRPSLWEMKLAGTIAGLFGCAVFYDCDLRWMFVGRDGRAAIARYAFSALYRQLKAARKEFHRKHLRRCSPARRNQRLSLYSEGWVIGVVHAVERLARPATDPLLRLYLEERHPELQKMTGRLAKHAETMDRERGWDAGRAVDLSIAVTAPAAPAQIGAC